MNHLNEEQDSITVKIKSIDNSIFEIRISISSNIQELKKIIERVETIILYLQKITHIPQSRQRLIYFGKVLNNLDTLASHKIEDNSFIHLVAIVNEDLLNQSPPPRGMSNENLCETEVVRTINDVQESRRVQRKKTLQQRQQGFPHLPSQPSPSLYQNLITMNQLLSSFNNIFEAQEHGQIFSHNNREFEIGTWVDVKDSSNEWQEAEIVQKKPEQILIHYNSSNRDDEWLPASSNRIAPFHSLTLQNTNANTFSPTPISLPLIQSDSKVPLIELFSMCSKTMTRVATLLERLAESYNYNKDLKLANEMQTLINGMIEEQRRNQEDKNEIIQQETDVVSVKSLKSMKSEKVSIDYETSSIKSMKSDISKFTITNPSTYLNNVPNNITEEEEDYQDDVSSQQEHDQHHDNVNSSKEIISAQNIEQFLLAAQLAPITDRLGRLLIDLSPYLAMTGANVQNHISSSLPTNISNLSIITNEGSQYSCQLTKNYYFQVPVMLTPQEINQIPQNNFSRLIGDSIDIHVNHFQGYQNYNSHIQNNNFQQQLLYSSREQREQQIKKSKQSEEIMMKQQQQQNQQGQGQSENHIERKSSQVEKKSKKKKSNAVSFQEKSTK